MARILVVDDAAFMRMMVRDMLKKIGHQVVGEAANGLQGVQMYKELKPDLVTMDVTMPEMDGVEAVKEIMAFDKDAKIVMISAMGQQAIVMDCIKAGAKDFIVKPFNIDRVAEAVKKVLG